MYSRVVCFLLSLFAVHDGVRVPLPQLLESRFWNNPVVLLLQRRELGVMQLLSQPRVSLLLLLLLLLFLLNFDSLFLEPADGLTAPMPLPRTSAVVAPGPHDV